MEDSSQAKDPYKLEPEKDVKQPDRHPAAEDIDNKSKNVISLFASVAYVPWQVLQSIKW